MRWSTFLLVGFAWFAACAIASAQTGGGPKSAQTPKPVTIEPPRPLHVNTIVIIGLNKDVEEIHKAIKLAPGQVLDAKAISDAEKALRPFGATIKSLPAGDGLVDVRITALTSLDQLIAEALKNNPDIRVADAKLREAEAEANRTRLKVASDVAILHGEIESAKAALDLAQLRLENAEKLRARAVIGADEVGAAKLTYLKFKAELASAEAKMPLLLGRLPGAKASDKAESRGGMLPPVTTISPYSAYLPYINNPGSVPWTLMPSVFATPTGMPPPATSSPLTDKLRKALDKSTGGRYEYGNTAPQVILDNLRDGPFAGINVHVRVKSLNSNTINVKLPQPVPFGAVLEYLEDELNIVFILRDYGIVVVAADEKLPPGAVRVVDFWKHGKVDTKSDKK